uniref:Uncharacterized protein n=1 Tax=Leersia perrieri TaxID=77586 RepID=A0A0D9XVV2_9ORYZ
MGRRGVAGEGEGTTTHSTASPPRDPRTCLVWCLSRASSLPRPMERGMVEWILLFIDPSGENSVLTVTWTTSASASRSLRAKVTAYSLPVHQSRAALFHFNLTECAGAWTW